MELTIGLIVVVVIFLLLAVLVIAGYNGLVRARNAYKNAFAQIDVQLRRRFDLIPNLIETAKAYLSHERQTLEAVVNARGAAMNGLAAAQANPGDPAAMQQLAQGQQELNGALFTNLVVEQYPDLKANQNMMQLSEELTSTENKVAFARQAYNDAVMSYNNRRETFPGNVYRRHIQLCPGRPARDPAGTPGDAGRAEGSVLTDRRP